MLKNDNDDTYYLLNSYIFYTFSLLFLLKQETRKKFIRDWKIFLNDFIKFELITSTENDLKLTTIEDFQEDDYKNASFIYVDSLNNKINKKEFSMFKKSLYSLKIDGLINNENYKYCKKGWDSLKFDEKEKDDLMKLFHSKLIAWNLGIKSNDKKSIKKTITISIVFSIIGVILTILCLLIPLLIRLIT